MEVRVASKQFIKPSSTTPPHPATLNPTFLDQLPLLPFIPLVFFYFDHPPIDSLKASLAETLTLFYRLAGVVKDDMSTVDCNDQGAYFVEARAKGRMRDLLARPDQRLINQLFPPNAHMLESARVTNIQANTFECGGIAIACCLRHIYTDLNGLANFLHAWAAATAFRDRSAVRAPNFITPMLFPASSNDMCIHDTARAMRAPFAAAGRFTIKRLLFNRDSVKKLQDEAVSGEIYRTPSRFEAVSACLWKSFIKASTINRGAIIQSQLRAATLPLDEQSMGNIVLHSCAKQPESDQLTTHSETYGQKIREEVKKVDGSVVARLHYEGSGALKSLLDELSKELASCGDMLGISSWCNFGLNDLNFGKEKPVWVAPGFLVEPENNKIGHICFLLDAADGYGVEAWFLSTEAYVGPLVSDLGQYKVVSVDPSPVRSS
uniref:Uncharacterized protein n=1 Tax=Kalanchoe fedtschenkoi TaxID=63787 RepID=A0A7N0ZXJ2_KALFE